MPRNVVVSVGILWGRPGTRTCGIFVGPPKASGRPYSRRPSGTPASGAGSRLGPRGWPAVDSPGYPGSPFSLDLGGAPKRDRPLSRG